MGDLNTQARAWMARQRVMDKDGPPIAPKGRGMFVGLKPNAQRANGQEKRGPPPSSLRERHCARRRPTRVAPVAVHPPQLRRRRRRGGVAGTGWW